MSNIDEQKNGGQPLRFTIVVAILSAISGLLGAGIGGHYVVKAAQLSYAAEIEKLELQTKEKHFDEFVTLISEYDALCDELVNVALLHPTNETKLIEVVSKVQRAGTRIMLVSSDDIASLVNSVNSYAALYLGHHKDKDSAEYLNKFGSIRVEMIQKVRVTVFANNRTIVSTSNLKSLHETP